MKRRTRVKILILFVLLFFAFPGQFSFAGAKGSKVKAGPSLVISQPTFEAGKVLEGGEVIHTFIIQNKGTKDLIIKSVKPG